MKHTIMENLPGVSNDRCYFCGKDYESLDEGDCPGPSFLNVIQEVWNKPYTVEDFQVKINEDH